MTKSSERGALQISLVLNEECSFCSVTLISQTEAAPPPATEMFTQPEQPPKSPYCRGTVSTVRRRGRDRAPEKATTLLDDGGNIFTDHMLNVEIVKQNSDK